MIALALLIVIGYLDYITGPEISFRIFYVGPIAVVAWRARQLQSALVAVAATIAWFWADVASGAQYSHGFYRYWNAAALFAFYIMVALLLCRLRDALQRETALLEKERELSRTDFLTGVPNLRAFHEFAEAEKNRARRYHHQYTIVYVDIDNFKAFNDHLGRSVGDALLAAWSAG
jgi:predicted signal transduction protein with EAL and GGDEF domain